MVEDSARTTTGAAMHALIRPGHADLHFDRAPLPLVRRKGHSMRFGLLKSIEGWRRFAMEIAIVVIGVLIALAAQQTATDWNEKQQAQTALAVVREELAINAGTFEERTLQQPCITRRLAEMTRVLAEARRTGRMPAVGDIGQSIARPTLRSAWEEASKSGATHRWQKADLAAISTIYSAQQPSDALTLAEAALWLRLDAPEMKGQKLSPSDLTMLSDILGQLRFFHWNNGADARELHKYITALGIRPSYRMIFDREGGTRTQVVEQIGKKAICQPLALAPDGAI